ncbi:ABC transporter permease [Anaerolentibacter hominis]|uniref:ABC transporter permease n=1 Tax=Anaerolentibacter hominis TaxID=3079009 RepID=UPI0031B8A3E2
MKGMLWKDFKMEIRKSLNRFFSIFLIVALGVAFFAGVRVSEPDMTISADTYFDSENMMDIRVLSTMGLTEGDLEAIRDIEGIKEVQGTYTQDVVASSGDNLFNVKVMAESSGINQMELVDGRLPEKTGECLLDNHMIENYGLQIGDKLKLSSGTDTELDEVLGQEEYTIVGTVNHPYYLSLDRGTTNIGDGKLNGFLVVPAGDFTLDVFTEILATVEDAALLNCYEDEYEDRVEEVRTGVEEIADSRCKLRFDDVKSEAEETLADAKNKLADAKAEAQEKLSDADKKIQDAQKKIDDGWEEVDKQEKKLDDGKRELAANEKKLSDAKRELETGQKEYEDGRKEIEENDKKLAETAGLLAEKEKELIAGEEQVSAGEKELELAQAELTSQKMILEDAKEKLAMLEAQIAQGVPGLEETYGALKQEIETGETQISEAEQTLAIKEGELAQTKYALGVAREQLDTAKEQLSQGQKELNKAKKELKKAGKTLEDGRKEVASGEKQIREAKQKITDGERQLKDAKQELTDGQSELEDAKQEYEDKKKEADEKIADAEDEILDGEEELNDLKAPEWYVLDRNSVQTYVEYGQDSERIGAIGKVFPAIFFLVAALVSLTTMTRMVEEERIQIGTLKALGYGKGSIASKFIFYALFASVGGSIFGVLIGETVLPKIIVSTYAILYNGLPKVLTPLHAGYGISATLLAVGCTTLATVFACYRELAERPAELMRPEPPKEGKRIFLERVTFLWKRLNFTKKAAVRNLFRYKKRFFMTIFGIGGCMALLMVGFGIRDSIYVVSSEQYTNIHLHDGSIQLDTDAGQRKRDALDELVAEREEIEDSMKIRDVSVDVGSGQTEKSAYIYVPEDPERMKDFVSIHNRLSGEEYTLTDQGVIITEKLAKVLDVKEGGTIYIKTDETHKKEVRVDHIAENYLYHYVYLTPKLYRDIFDEEPEYNEILINNVNRDEDMEAELAKVLLENKAVKAVTMTNFFQDKVNDMLHNLNVIVWVLIISAGLLAFVVLYNLNNININERKRELATLKVLGFYDTEVASYVYRENVLLTTIGVAVGLILGFFLHKYVIITVEIDLLMFGRNISAASCFYSAVLTFVFSVFVNFVMYYKLKKIDMVESMKSVE